MTNRRPGALAIGARVQFDGTVLTVTGITGSAVLLTDAAGRTLPVEMSEVCSPRAVFEAADGPRTSIAVGMLPGVPAGAAEQARWWEGHILEVMTGQPADPGAQARSEYDPEHSTLAERETAKARELTAAGHESITARRVNRKRLRYQAEGLAGLADRRSDRDSPVGARLDARVVQATRRAIEETTMSSTRTIGFLRWRVEQILVAEHGPGAVAMPSRAAFYRLYDRLSQGTHATGSARIRRSIAARPEAPYGVFTPVRPGELIQIDSTPLDVAVLLDDGVVGRVELTGMIDVATRTVTAAVLRPSTKAVDASLLLARTVTPEPMRPGWSEALRMANSVLPYRRMLALDERLEQAADRPVIIPETIVCDQGKVFVSNTFRAACRLLGIDFQPAHAASPAEKPHIEKMMFSVGTLFAQYTTGYLGSSTERRGRAPECDRLWSLPELQNLLDEWLIVWQNRKHDGLRDPSSPGRCFTPNEKYATLIESCGYIPLALSAEDYVELLPAAWRAINHYGVKIGHRTYDAEELGPLRRQHSGLAERRHLWEVHYDPYDVTRVWVRRHWDSGWITCYWKHLRTAPTPFGELAWNHAIDTVRARGGPLHEQEIAQAAAALLERAHQGPQTASGPGPGNRRRGRRVVARTRAVGPSVPADLAAAQPPQSEFENADEDEQPLAQVVPLPIFDARAEAERWW